MHQANMEIEHTYQKYLARIQKLDFYKIAPLLGLKKEGSHYSVPFFNTHFLLLPNGFLTSNKTKPPYDICIVLCKYLLLCPETEPRDKNFVSFKDFKDSGPLTVYFSTDVEQKICQSFSGNLKKLQVACRESGGSPVSFDADYDLIMRFKPLPKLPLVLLFNDRDDEFEAQSKVLFELRAQDYLDAECLAILGNLLFQTLVH